MLTPPSMPTPSGRYRYAFILTMMAFLGETVGTYTRPGWPIAFVATILGVAALGTLVGWFYIRQITAGVLLPLTAFLVGLLLYSGAPH
jgi:hypothetical protein